MYLPPPHPSLLGAPEASGLEQVFPTKTCGRRSASDEPGIQLLRLLASRPVLHFEQKQEQHGCPLHPLWSLAAQMVWIQLSDFHDLVVSALLLLPQSAMAVLCFY